MCLEPFEDQTSLELLCHEVMSVLPILAKITNLSDGFKIFTMCDTNPDTEKGKKTLKCWMPSSLCGETVAMN